MSEVPIVDYQRGLEWFGGDEESFKIMINSYDQEYFNEEALSLHKGIMKRDFEEIWIRSYRIKGPVSYIPAPRLKNICAELQRKGQAKEPMDLIMKDYMTFLDEAREFKREIAKIMKRPVSLDTADFDIFETQVKTAFPKYFPNSTNVSPICHGCNIF